MGDWADEEAAGLIRRVGPCAECEGGGPPPRDVIATALRSAERRGLERGAGVCESRSEQWSTRGTSAVTAGAMEEAHHSANEATDCADAIRALAEREESDG